MDVYISGTYDSSRFQIVMIFQSNHLYQKITYITAEHDSSISSLANDLIIDDKLLNCSKKEPRVSQLVAKRNLLNSKKNETKKSKPAAKNAIKNSQPLNEIKVSLVQPQSETLIENQKVNNDIDQNKPLGLGNTNIKSQRAEQSSIHISNPDKSCTDKQIEELLGVNKCYSSQKLISKKIMRRNNNRIAAAKCRKRKIDTIRCLEVLNEKIFQKFQDLCTLGDDFRKEISNFKLRSKEKIFDGANERLLCDLLLKFESKMREIISSVDNLKNQSNAVQRYESQENSNGVTNSGKNLYVLKECNNFEAPDSHQYTIDVGKFVTQKTHTKEKLDGGELLATETSDFDQFLLLSSPQSDYISEVSI
ncbi:MAG: hypothetical protein MHMPM18_001726 [Marteilia pararefringens]